MRKLLILLAAICLVTVFSIPAAGATVASRASPITMLVDELMTTVLTDTAPNHQIFAGLLEVQNQATFPVAGVVSINDLMVQGPRHGYANVYANSEYNLAGYGYITSLSVYDVRDDNASLISMMAAQDGTLPGPSYLCFAAVAFHEMTGPIFAIQEQRHNAAYNTNWTNTLMSALVTRNDFTIAANKRGTVLRL